MKEPSTNLEGPADQSSALSDVIDDLSVQVEAYRWAEEQLLAGRSLEDLIEELYAQGWDYAIAENIVDQVRKDTRSQRGVLTREQVVSDLNVDYRRATGGLSVAFRSGLFGLYGFTTGFMAAWRSVRKLKRMIGKK